MKALLSAAMLIAMSLALSGCFERDVAYKYYEEMGDDNTTPARTSVEHDGRISRTVIHNLDKANADMTRLLLLDRPSRTLFYPVD